MIQSELSCAQVVKEIGADNVSGASELSRKAASSFVLFASESSADSGQEYFRGLSELGAKLILAQPHMASIFNVVNSILYSVEQSLPALSGGELADFTREKAEEFIANSLNAVQLIAENGQADRRRFQGYDLLRIRIHSGHSEEGQRDGQEFRGGGG